MVFDNKKEHKEFYLPPKTPGIVNAPAMSFWQHGAMASLRSRPCGLREGRTE